MYFEHNEHQMTGIEKPNIFCWTLKISVNVLHFYVLETSPIKSKIKCALLPPMMVSFLVF